MDLRIGRARDTPEPDYRRWRPKAPAQVHKVLAPREDYRVLLLSAVKDVLVFRVSQIDVAENLCRKA
jgi:hypothetical protein